MVVKGDGAEKSRKSGRFKNETKRPPPLSSLPPPLSSLPPPLLLFLSPPFLPLSSPLPLSSLLPLLLFLSPPFLPLSSPLPLSLPSSPSPPLPLSSLLPSSSCFCTVEKKARWIPHSDHKRDAVIVQRGAGRLVVKSKDKQLKQNSHRAVHTLMAHGGRWHYTQT